MSAQDPLKENEPHCNEAPDSPLVPRVPRPAGRHSGMQLPEQPSAGELMAESSALQTDEQKLVEPPLSESSIDASPAVSISEGDNEPENTAVGEVPAKILALSVRPPLMADVDFDEETRAFTAPEELLEMARRQRDALANSEENDTCGVITPRISIDCSTRESETKGASDDQHTHQGPSSTVIPLVKIRANQAGSGNAQDSQNSAPGSKPEQQRSGRVPADTVSTVAAPSVPASISSMAPSTGDAERSLGNTKRSRPGQSSAGMSGRTRIIVVLGCLLIGYWLFTVIL